MKQQSIIGRIAVIADIHGNVDALTAVLQDIDQQAITTIINLGDHLSGPLAAYETAELLLTRDMINIRGNHDRLLLERPSDEMGLSDKAAFDQLEDRHLDWLRTLPSTTIVDDEIFVCHATPANDAIYWLETVSADGVVSMRPQSEIIELASDIDYPLILCGHTHIPRVVHLSDEQIIVNPGSVGLAGYDDIEPVPHVMQTGNLDACYAIVERGNLGWSVTLKSVPYDATRMIQLAETGGRAEWARALKTGWAFP